MITCGAKNWSQLRIPNPSGQFAQRLLADSDVPTIGIAIGHSHGIGIGIGIGIAIAIGHTRRRS